MWPEPMRQAYLLVGWRKVPPRFLKLWRTMILLLLSMTAMANESSLAIVVSLDLLDLSGDQAAMNVAVFMLPASFVGREEMKSFQFGKSIVHFSMELG